MAKPEHTAYQVQADFDSVIKGIDVECISSGKLKQMNWRKTSMHFNHPANAYVSFGYAGADALLKQCRAAARQEFKKGERPTFFLRKMTMSEFMAHKEFKKYRSSNPTVQKVFKKYLLLDNLRDSGFQETS